MLLLVASAHFPLTYCLLHTARGTEVIRAVKNPSLEPLGDDRFGVWRPVGGGVSRMWSSLFTFYARTFQPGEPIRFDFGWAVQPDTGDPFDDAAGTGTGAIFGDVYGRRLAPESTDAGALGRTYAAEGGETPQAIAKRYDALTRERWATELKAANPQRDWTARIYAGDVIAVPDAWPQPFWGAAKEHGLLEASGPIGAPALAAADPFRELRVQRGRLS